MSNDANLLCNQPLPCARRTLSARAVALCVSLAVLVLLSGCDNAGPGSNPGSNPLSQNAAPSAEDGLALDIELANPNPGYVGIDQCTSCHQARCDEFRETRHFVASARPDPDQMPKGFDAPEVTIGSHLPDHSFQTNHQRSMFSVSSSRKTGSPAEVLTTNIALAYGMGGGADEVYFGWQGNELRELPIGWLHPQNCWGAQQFSAPDPTDDLSRVATTRCLECHTTWFEHSHGTANTYRPESLLLGVTCERCHGPAKDHVTFHREHPAEKLPQSILHPGKLSRERLMDLCGQCHSASVFRRTDVFSYRPGELLSDRFRQHQNPNFEDDNVANQVKYLSQSKCFQQSTTMTCITCHSPHHTISSAEQGQSSCRTCHAQDDCHEQSRLPDDVKSQCSSCHMPEYSRLAVRFHTASDRYVFPVRPTQHKIGIYPEARDAVLLAWHSGRDSEQDRTESARLRNSLQNHWTHQAGQFLDQHRLIAAIGALREALRFGAPQETQKQLDDVIRLQTQVERNFSKAMSLQSEERFREAIVVLEELLQIKPDHAMAHAKIGTFLAVLGESEKAIRSLNESVSCDPDNSYGLNMLGWLAYLRGDGKAAAEYFRKAEDVYPFTAENNYRWGLALMQLQSWNEAQERLQVALRTDPNNSAVCRALCTTCIQLEQAPQALKYIHRAAMLSEFQDPEILLELTDAFIACNRPTDATATALQGLSLAGARNSEAGTALQQRLMQLRNNSAK